MLQLSILLFSSSISLSLLINHVVSLVFTVSQSLSFISICFIIFSSSLYLSLSLSLSLFLPLSLLDSYFLYLSPAVPASFFSLHSFLSLLVHIVFHCPSVSLSVYQSLSHNLLISVCLSHTLSISYLFLLCLSLSISHPLSLPISSYLSKRVSTTDTLPRVFSFSLPASK